jgi:hypothetical protein
VIHPIEIRPLSPDTILCQCQRFRTDGTWLISNSRHYYDSPPNVSYVLSHKVPPSPTVMKYHSPCHGQRVSFRKYFRSKFLVALVKFHRRDSFTLAKLSYIVVRILAVLSLLFLAPPWTCFVRNQQKCRDDKCLLRLLASLDRRCNDWRYVTLRAIQFRAASNNVTNQGAKCS